MGTLTCTLTDLEALLGELGLNAGPEFSEANILHKPVDIYRSHLITLLSLAVPDCDKSVISEAIQSPSDIMLGDLALVLPRLRLKDVSVKVLASQIMSHFPSSPLLRVPFLEGVHLRFFFSQKTLPRLLLPYISDRKSSYGDEPSHGLRDPLDPERGHKTVIVEFSSPNMASEFTSNHLRSTILGAFIANLYERMGWEVIRLNYLGDWGKNIALFAVGWKKYGSEDLLQSDPLGHILDVYTKIKSDLEPEEKARQEAKEAGESTVGIESQGIFAARDAFFKELEEGDGAALEFWKRFRGITIEHLTTAYDRFGIKFDEYAGESQVKPETISKVESALKERGILEESEGSWIIDFTKHSGSDDTARGLKTTIIRPRGGSTNYLSRDIATILDRERAYTFDKMIYVVTSQQDSHFKEVFTTLELMGRPDLKEKVQHINFGILQGLSKHLANAKLLHSMLEQCAKLMQDAMAAEGGEQVNGNAFGAVGDFNAVSALLAQDMSSKRSHGYSFDPKRMVSFDGATGLRLQTSHTRLSAVIAELQTDNVEAADIDYSAIEHELSADLLRLMAQYPDVTASTFKSLEPHGILSYLFRLANSLDLCFADPEDGEDGEASKKEEELGLEARRAKLELYTNARQVLENGMKLLGFPILARRA